MPKAAGSQKQTATGRALHNTELHSSGDSPFALSEISLAYAQQDGRAGLRPILIKLKIVERIDVGSVLPRRGSII